MNKKEVKKILKDYKDYLNKTEKGWFVKISDYSLDKYIKEQLTLTDVVGQSEQYHCELYDFGRKDKPCDKQCDGCKAMKID